MAFIRVSVCLFAAALTAAAQDYYRNSIEIGGGAAIPLFTRSTQIWENSSMLAAGYGFRFARRLQADVGYSRVFGVARKQFESGGGSLDSYLGGGRVLFPVRGRVLLSAGAGVVYEQFKPPVASAGETGWGAYLLGSASVGLDRSRHFYVAVSPRLEVVQSATAWLHRNRWLAVPVSVGFRF